MFNEKSQLRGGVSIMDANFLSLVSESKALNSSVFSLPRLQLLAGLSDLGQDGATFTELKIALDTNDGALYANLKALEEMGYLTSRKVALENKTVEAYMITSEGKNQWLQVKKWFEHMAQWRKTP